MSWSLGWLHRHFPPQYIFNTRSTLQQLSTSNCVICSYSSYFFKQPAEVSNEDDGSGVRAVPISADDPDHLNVTIKGHIETPYEGTNPIFPPHFIQYHSKVSLCCSSCYYVFSTFYYTFISVKLWRRSIWGGYSHSQGLSILSIQSLIYNWDNASKDK